MGKLAAEHNPFKSAGGFDRVGFTVGAENSNTITINCQFKDANGNNIVEPVSGRCYLAADSVGLNPVSTAPSGGFAAGTNGAITPMEHGSSGVGKQGFFTTEANGTLDVAIVESGALSVYLVIVKPDGRLAVSNVATFT